MKLSYDADEYEFVLRVATNCRNGEGAFYKYVFTAGT